MRKTIRFESRPRETEPQIPRRMIDDVGFLLNEAAFVVRTRMIRALETFHISPRQIGIIELIAQEGPLTQQAIGAAFRIDRTSMVQLIDGLEAAGLVVRGVNPDDRRAHALTLTPEGKAMLARTVKVIEQAQAEFLSSLAVPERDELRRLLIMLLRGLSSDAVTPPTHDDCAAGASLETGLPPMSCASETHNDCAAGSTDEPTAESDVSCH